MSQRTLRSVRHSYKNSERHQVAVLIGDEGRRAEAAQGSRLLLEALDRYWLNNPTSGEPRGNWAGARSKVSAQVARGSSEVGA